MKLYGGPGIPTAEKLNTTNMSDSAVKQETLGAQQKTLESLQRQQQMLAATTSVSVDLQFYSQRRSRVSTCSRWPTRPYLRCHVKGNK